MMAPDEPRSLLAVRPGPLGNALAAVPALRALRHRYPAAHLALVVAPPIVPLFAGCAWLDTCIGYDPRDRDRGLLAYWRIVMAIRQTQPTHAVLFKRFLRAALLARLAGASVRVGFDTDGRAPLLTHAVPYRRATSIVELNLELVATLDAPAVGRHLEVFPSSGEDGTAQRVVERCGLEAGCFVAAHYGGTTTRPDFVPRSRFVELLAAVAAGEPIVLVGAGAHERNWAGELAGMLPRADVVVDEPLGVVAGILRRARAFVGFSSGPAHLAAAVGRRPLVCFRPGPGVEAEIAEWLPPGARALIPPPAHDEVAWADCLGRVRTGAVD